MEDSTRIAEIENEIEAQALRAALDAEGIPHILRSFYDAAYDGIFQLQKGWGAVYAPPEYEAQVLAALDSIRQEQPAPPTVPRLFNACLLRPQDLDPSSPELAVAGVFNPGAIEHNGEVLLLARVAECAAEDRPGFTASPRLDLDTGQVIIDWFDNREVRKIDPRLIEVKESGAIRLTFLSHLRLFRSPDGKSFTPADVSFLPASETETYGVEDPRITKIGDTCYLTYVAVSPHGAATALAATQDFQTFQRLGIIFPPENKDVVLFPEPIDGEFVALHRPTPATPFGMPEMWLARSPDLLHWGKHEPVHTGATGWESGRIGAGAPPIKLDSGWLEIYHGNQKPPAGEGVGIYAAGALLLDLEHPGTIRKCSAEALFLPESDFECNGFVPDVLFPTAVIEREDTLLIYYGAADENTGVIECAKEDLLAALD